MALSSRLDAAGLGLVLLAIGYARHFGWDKFPPEMRGVASKGLGAAAALALLAIIVALVRAWPAILAAAWYAFEEMQTVICCSWWILVEPWPVKPGEPMCSAKAGFDIGALTTLSAVAVLWFLTRKSLQAVKPSK